MREDVRRAGTAPRQVRIIGGLWRGSRLPVADRPGLRPTPDRVRETLFNWLGQALPGWRCLDAFAGSGALGFEAASRGAASVLMVERDPRLADSLRQVRERLRAETVRVLCAEGLATLRAQPAESFDLVFLDPPYDSGLLQPALHEAARVVVPGGFVHAEHRTALSDCDRPSSLSLVRHARAGQVHHHLLQRPA